jgi:hypothetical protein
MDDLSAETKAKLFYKNAMEFLGMEG